MANGLLAAGGDPSSSTSSAGDTPQPPPSSTGAPESKALQRARAALSAAQADVASEQARLASTRDELARDFGPGDVFRALKGACVTLDTGGEYTYELCFMERATQKPNKGGAHTHLGTFSRFETLRADADDDGGGGHNVDDDDDDNDDEDDDADDSNGPGDGSGGGSSGGRRGGSSKKERLVMKYDNGQYCWNGPARSTTVVLACADSDVIRKVVEEEKCVYRMDVGTPAVCGNLTSFLTSSSASPAESNPNTNKDEL